MKKMWKSVKILIVVCTFLLPGSVFSQTPFDPDDCGEVGDVNDNIICPLDGGVSILVAAAIGFGFKSANDRKKQLKKDNQVL